MHKIRHSKATTRNKNQAITADGVRIKTQTQQPPPHLVMRRGCALDVPAAIAVKRGRSAVVEAGGASPELPPIAVAALQHGRKQRRLAHTVIHRRCSCACYLQLTLIVRVLESSATKFFCGQIRCDGLVLRSQVLNECSCAIMKSSTSSPKTQWTHSVTHKRKRT